MTTARTRSTLARWGKFNLVGAVGIGVQFAVLFLLKGILHVDVLIATAVAVETAVLHNFFWHERFTWADRVVLKVNNPDFFQRECAPNRPRLCPGSVRRLWRFHAANGGISILGNLAIMKALVGFEHMNYLVANAIAIAVCSLLNFLLSDQWVFES